MTENPATDPFQIWQCPGTGCGHVITSSVPMEREEVLDLMRTHLGHCPPLRNWIRRLERQAGLALEVIKGEDINELHELASAVQYWRDLENPPPIPEGMSVMDAEIARALGAIPRRLPSHVGAPTFTIDTLEQAHAGAIALAGYLEFLLQPADTEEPS